MDAKLKEMKLFIWDFDGTLMDTYPVTFCAFLQQALRDFGHDVPQEEIMAPMLVNVGHAVQHYTRLYQLPELPERYAYYHAQGPVAPPQALPQVDEVLETIRRSGGINCIFTHRNSATFAMLEHGGLLDAFEEIITSEHPRFATKPAPDCVQYFMEKYSIAPEKTVIVGDRECDLGSGRNAGCHTLHLLTPAAPEYPECDWRIENFAQMLEMLQ